MNAPSLCLFQITYICIYKYTFIHICIYTQSSIVDECTYHYLGLSLLNGIIFGKR
ncbi:hypothetical protein BDB01DRAFT_216998 [Pilobolus umbonatus]|nr:hypothetical protein BDB01DRAFT_216998 [Pilobolus umbonatus]